MPLYGYKQSEEHKRKIGKAIKIAILEGRLSPPDNKGRKITEETKRKISIAKKGKPNFNQRRDKHPQWKGGKPKCIYCGTRTKDYYSKMCFSCWTQKNKGSNNYFWKGGKPKCIDCNKEKGSYVGKRCNICATKGSNSNLWKGGITSLHLLIRSSREYKIWREAVFKRDNYTCIWCGIRGGKLNADHIKPFSLFPELRFAIDNGRTLCVDCHKKTDTYGSYSRIKYKK